MTFTEMFSYTPAGLTTKKKLRGYRYYPQQPLDLEALWAYDNDGRVASLTYPNNGSLYTHGYDSLGRPNRLTLNLNGQPWYDVVGAVTYGPAGNLTAMSWGAGFFSETRTYNPRLQLTRQTAQPYYGPSVDLEYRYSATQNNGQITQLKDWTSGEEVSCQYDSLSRLISAVTTGPEWGQSYSYDGFGNRTLVTVTKGTAPAGNLTYDGMTNRITNSGFSYDANGNLTAMPGMSLYYDYDNRLTSATGSNGTYLYDPENRRVGKVQWSWGPFEVYFYGVDGRKLGTYSVSWDPILPLVNVSTVHENLYFAGRLIKSNNKWVVTDRLGSVVKSETETLRYFPWGEERSTTTQNRDKFATYHRDSSGFDYALNRYYSPSHGRFLTPDPYVASASLTNPQSWNRYPYVENDPVNLADPAGLYAVDPCAYAGCLMAPPDPETGAGGGIIWIGAMVPPEFIMLPGSTEPGSGLDPVSPNSTPLTSAPTVALPWCPYPTPACLAVNTFKIMVPLILAAWQLKERSQDGQARDIAWAEEKLRRECGKTLTNEQRRRVHDQITGQDLSREEVLEIMKDVAGCPGAP